MANFMKSWQQGDTYHFVVELNRIETYNEYVDSWLKNYYGKSYATITNKTNWSNTDIVDLNDINRIIGNVNLLLTQMSTLSPIPNQQLDQAWNYPKENELEETLITNLKILGNAQFQCNVTGLAICGNDLKLNMGE